MFSNGIITFKNPEQSGLSWSNLSVQPFTHNMGSQFDYSIFPLWTDLINISGTFQTEGSTTFQRYKWIGISPFYDASRLNTFSVELKPDGRVIANYSLVDVDYGYVGLTGNTAAGEYEQIAALSGRTTSIPNWERIPQAVDRCSFDPLSSPTCPGYLEAYKNQQCSINPLFDPTCPGYATAYFSYQCSINPLYDQTCPGYAQAYLTQQCNANQLFSPQCPGYAQAKALKDMLEQQSTASSETPGAPSTSTLPTSSTTTTVEKALADPTRTETAVTVDVGGVELTTTGEVSVPTGQTQATKEAIKESAVEERKQEERKQEEKKRVDPRALAVARAAVAATERTAMAVSEAAVAFSQSETATSSTLGLGTGVTLSGFRPIGITQETDNNKELNTTTKQNNTVELTNTNTVATQQPEVQTKNTSSVRNGGKVEGMEGGPDPAQLAKAPMDFNQYLNMQLKDAQFYAAKEIYKNQKVIDNQRVLRQLSGKSDRMHEEMVNEQYKNR